MALKRVTVEEFDEDGKLRKRTVTEEDDGQLHLVPTYPAAPLYPWPAPPAIISVPIPVVPQPNPWGTYDPPQPVIITCRQVNGISITPQPQLTASTANTLVH